MSIELARAARKEWINAQVRLMTDTQVTLVADHISADLIAAARRGTAVVHTDVFRAVQQVLEVPSNEALVIAKCSNSCWNVVHELRNLGYTVSFTMTSHYGGELTCSGWSE